MNDGIIQTEKFIFFLNNTSCCQKKVRFIQFIQSWKQRVCLFSLFRHENIRQWLMMSRFPPHICELIISSYYSMCQIKYVANFWSCSLWLVCIILTNEWVKTFFLSIEQHSITIQYQPLCLYDLWPNTENTEGLCFTWTSIWTKPPGLWQCVKQRVAGLIPGIMLSSRTRSLISPQLAFQQRSALSQQSVRPSVCSHKPLRPLSANTVIVLL